MNEFVENEKSVYWVNVCDYLESANIIENLNYYNYLLNFVRVKNYIDNNFNVRYVIKINVKNFIEKTKLEIFNLKVLVTGISRFIGIYVAKRFLDEGYSVVGFKKFNYYY